MEVVSLHSQKILLQIQTAIVWAEQQFIKRTQNIDFFIFCLLYSVILVLILRKITKPKNFRPQNKELVSKFIFQSQGFKQYYKDAVTNWVMGLPIIRGITGKKITAELQKVDQELTKDFQKSRDQRKAYKLPPTGMTEENLRKRVKEWSEKEYKNMSTGKISGAVYLYDESYYEQLTKFASKYMYHNPLHLDTYKQLLQMQSQVLKMTASLISKNPQKNAFGIITSGGSQSLIMCLYAYKKFYSNRTKPNIVVPNSIHAAIDKGCFYFNIQVRKVRLNENYQADIKHMESLIDSNTILLMGSYPNFPHGIIDPVREIARLGKKYNVGVHIDGCLGGFVAAFDKQHAETFNIDLDGVTSVSLDHHKFALAPKGISTVFFKTNELRHCMYYMNSTWVGGLYATPSFCGSRNGFASAGAWYAMTRITKNGYKQNTKTVIQATVETAKKLREIPGIRVFGKPSVCVVAFDSQQTNCYDLCTYLNKQKGYDISPIHLPKGIHISMTLANCQKIRNELAGDIIKGIQHLKKNPPGKSASSAIYGATSSLPSADVGDDLLKVIIGSTLK